MTSTSKKFLLLITLINVIGSVMSIFLIFSDRFGESPIFVPLAILNGIVLLVYVRLIRLNDNLTRQQQELWTIVVFVGLGIGQLAYFMRHRSASS